MASTGGARQVDNNFAPHPDTSAAEAALRAKLSRKRTKTGCLTCRRRRIKCGEERPVCRNCVKSKRSCEGYNQRVVFKPPSFDFRPGSHGGAHITFQAGAPGPVAPWTNEYGPPVVSQMEPHQPVVFFGAGQQHGFPVHHPMYPPQEPRYYPVQPPPPQQVTPPQVPMHFQFEGTTHPHYGMSSQYSEPHPNGTSPAWAFAGSAGATMYPVESVQSAPQASVRMYPQPDWSMQHNVRHEQNWEAYSPTPNTMPPQVSPSSTLSSRTLPGNTQSAVESSSQSWLANDYEPRPEGNPPVDRRPPLPQLQPTQHRPYSVPMSAPASYDIPEFYEHELHVEPLATPTQFLQQAAVEKYDTDYYDVRSDEDLATEATTLATGEQSRQISFQKIIHANNIIIEDPQTRRYDTFIYAGILDQYRPNEVANPLNNEATARLFLHFVAVTGPMLSIYERQVRNTSMLFTEGQVPFAQQGLWTYTMPMMALRNRGLLHAMLALASLHVARLTSASITPSIQHYAWALKRIHAVVGQKGKKRYEISTIAASMLLGFYEILTADHVKWNTHLMGAKQLFLETDFSTMTKQFRRMKIERANLRQGERKYSMASQPRDEILDQIHDVDERMVSELSGIEVRYDAHGQILTPGETIPQELDLSKFEILKDLYWWYLKQDAYQSVISGNPPMLDYSRWTECPPRAPLGKPDAIYGTFDHLVLLLGRIADFSARDRTRKLKVMEANGGQWRPAQAMKMPGPPQGAPPTPVSATARQHQNGVSFPVPPAQAANPPMGPQFYGMAPPPRQDVRMPASYYMNNKTPTPEAASPQGPVDLNAATQAALEEYGRIRAALHTFSNKLGDRFSPLTTDHQPELKTPFGPALFYRSYDIGVIWAIYHMSMIIAIRSHPHMHPAAHAAAAIAAEETRFFANEIGRIAAGIVPSPPDQPLNPSLGASLTESCMASFFAAVQYQDADQRQHTVLRIRSIAQRTGWGSAELIANGCETAWVKAAEAGRGQPYTRVARKEHSADPRLNGSWERLDPNGLVDQEDPTDRRLVSTMAKARINWAIGLLGTEDDEKG